MRYALLFLLSVILAVAIPQELASKDIPGGYPVPPKIEYSQEEITCLAENIFYETLGEPIEGKLAVATVTMNRVRHRRFPNTICEVVYQRNQRGCQFSWTCGAKTKFVQSLYEEHYNLAKEFLTYEMELDRLNDALFFHATYVNPQWGFAKKIEQIGNHIFYEENV